MFNFKEKIEIRDPYHEMGNIGQFEDLIARHNLEGTFGHFALILLAIGMISLLVHAILWINKSRNILERLDDTFKIVSLFM